MKVKARKVTVKGPKGEVTKDFSHAAVEMAKVKMNTKKMKGDYLRIRLWFGFYKQSCAVNTLRSLISNMITGVTTGFVYKMRLVHAHFPINVNIPKDGKSIEVKNFLGGKKIHKVSLMPGTTVASSVTVKDELIFTGIDNANISLTCSVISQSCKIGKKDDRKFLDGIYVSEKGTAE